MINMNFRIKIFFLLVFIFFLSACETQKENIGNTSMFGFTISDEPLSKSKVQEILYTLLPDETWIQHGFKNSVPSEPKAYVVDYGIQGKIINIDRRLSGRDNILSVHIERIASTKLRHKVMIETDKAKWKVIKKEITHHDNSHQFYRVYLLQHISDKLFQGIIFMDGVWVVLQWTGTPSNENINNLKNIVWIIAENLKLNYEKMILPIAKELGEPIE